MNAQNFSRSKLMWFCLDFPFRLAALYLGLMALLALNRFSMKASFSLFDLLIIAEAALMFMCLATPLYPSRKWFRGLLMVAVLASIYFLLRHVPSMQREGFPSDVVLMNLTEIVVAVWFLLRAGGKLPSNKANKGPR